MPVPFAATIYPEDRQWLGIGREITAAGTAVLPASTIPVEKPAPDEKVTWIKDKSFRGSMATTYGQVQGVEESGFDIAGPVYMNTLGYLLHNLWGDYTATGSTPTNSTTIATTAVTVGATSCTVASGTGYAIGQAVQLGITADGNPEIVVLTAVAGVTLTFANTPARFGHAIGKTVATVVAPFTHIFALLNSGIQPVTHTLTHYQGISGANGAKQYAYWCASEIALTANVQQAFMHDTKGQSVLGVPAASAPVNTVDTSLLQASWEALVGIGGPASGGTLVSNVIEPKLNFIRQLKPWWALSGFQAPVSIARNGLTVTGGFTHLAVNESPMLNMLNNVQPQIQIIISNGLSGANLLSCQFDAQIAAYETTKLNGNEEFEYEVAFEAIANTTNVGQSGGFSPGKVTLQNAIPTY